MRGFRFGLLIAACLAAAPAVADVTFGTLLNDMVDRDRLAVHPSLNNAYRTAQASSHDRNPTTLGAPAYFANGDHTNFLGREWVDGAWEYVMFADDGPGTLDRWWMTTSEDAGEIRVYVDGSATPALAGPLHQTLGANATFGNELSFRTRNSVHSGHNLYAPIPYAQGVKVTYRGPVNQSVYYNVNYRQYEPGTVVESYSATAPTTYAAELAAARAALANPSVTGHVDNHFAQNKTLAAGQDLVCDLRGTGAIRQLRVNVSSADQVAAMADTYVELTFDGQRTARVPLGQFFGNGDGTAAAPYNTIDDLYRTVVTGGLLISRWVMPYEKAAEVRLVNEGGQNVQVALQVDSGEWTWDASSMHFHANYREENNVKTRGGNGTADFRYLTVRGQGVYVGDSLSLRNGSSSWWGEGDEKVYVDYVDDDGVGHNAQPDHIGTGSEDYYGYAWGHPDTFRTAFISQPLGRGNNTAGGQTVNARMRALDAVPFDESFKFDIEMWHWADTQVDYGATTYWYGRPGASAMRAAADLGVDFRPGHDFATGGIPDTAGDGQWVYLSSSNANPSDPAAQTAAMTFGDVGNAGHQGYGGGENGHNLGAISNEYLFVDGGNNGGVQGSPGYHELALHPAGMVWSGAFEGDPDRPFVVARWIAGESSQGLANVNGSVRNFIDNSDSVDFYIFVDGLLEFSAEGIITTLPETYFDFDVTLHLGSTVDFVLGNGGVGNLFGDESFLRATILVLESPPQIPGDANRDGRVDAADAAALAANWLRADGVSWQTGDFNGDAVVNDLDLAILAANWQPAGDAPAVPEPPAGILLAGAALLLVGRMTWFGKRSD
ncbi:MAG: DUF2961 domain-containing protein [Pirellulales bacterium]|nr:DUF2961 domain-containing protein [Pirellulales bacterium]